MPFDWLLAGIETEYGLAVDGRGAEDQIDDSADLVRACQGAAYAGWDYRFESPRADLRGFRLERLQVDPEDAKFDRPRQVTSDEDVRSDRVLPNGARFYNDHGHPEYATPECRSLHELMLHDLAGERFVLAAAADYARETGREVRVYKNNTDFHGASYGTHESYLAPRSLGFEGLYQAVMPMLVARQILCGAGKAGIEGGAGKPGWLARLAGGDQDRPHFQLSQRADFFVEPFNAETLFRRPVFNTRDEPHADPTKWIRMHVIAGDANRMPSATRRKVGLVQLAVALAAVGEAPVWRIRDPVEVFQSISRSAPTSDSGYEAPEFRIELEGSWTTAEHVIESYLSAAEKVFGLHVGADEYGDLIHECRELIDNLRHCPDRFRTRVDWAAKQHLLRQYVESEGVEWSDPVLQALDLEYHNVDPDQSLFGALAETGETEVLPETSELDARLGQVREPTRAIARGLAVTKFAGALRGVSWAALTFEIDDETIEVHLDPTKVYGPELGDIEDVKHFAARLEEIADDDHPN